MNRLEKLFSLLGLFYITAMVILILTVPSMRNVLIFLPLALVGIIVNAVLLFIVFRDIFIRSFQPESRKYFWVLVILLFLPAIVIYLPLHGFKPR